MFRNKAQRAGNGISLVKRCNAVAGHCVDALRVGLSAPMALLRLLARGTAIALPVLGSRPFGAGAKKRSRRFFPGEACLAMNADKSTEPGNIILKEY